jgi:hypothetical protein
MSGKVYGDTQYHNLDPIPIRGANVEISNNQSLQTTASTKDWVVTPSEE